MQVGHRIQRTANFKAVRDLKVFTLEKDGAPCEVIYTLRCEYGSSVYERFYALMAGLNVGQRREVTQRHDINRR